jgi:hypothetical protein
MSHFIRSVVQSPPKLRWLDSVLKDVKLLKVETWWKKARDRNISGRIIKEAKVHKGPQKQRKKKWYSLHVHCSSESRLHKIYNFSGKTV